MKRSLFHLIMLLILSVNIFAQDKKYGIAINESDKMIMTPCTVVDTASVMATVNNFMTPFLSLRDYVGKETDSQELLQYAIQLSEKCPGYPNEKASIVRSAQKGKIDYALKGYIDAIIAEYNKFINYISKDNCVEIEYSYSGLSQYKIYDWERAMIFGLDSIPYTTKMVMYKNPYYRPEYEDKDYLDINNQNLDAAWIFNEEGKSKSQSYPIEMNYTYYASHPDLIISGNGIYDKEYNLKRIITLRRNEIGWGQNIGTFRLNKDNGIYYIDDNLRNAIKNCFYISDYKDNKYNIKNNISSNTKYAIENLVGISQNSVKFEEDALLYDAVNFVRRNQNILNKMTAKEKENIKKEWARLSNFPEKYNTHKTKMRDETARRWYNQVQSDHEEDIYEYYKIERIDDLHFKIMVTNAEHKSTLDVVVEFYQDSSSDNKLAYNWRITDYKVYK